MEFRHANFHWSITLASFKIPTLNTHVNQDHEISFLVTPNSLAYDNLKDVIEYIEKTRKTWLAKKYRGVARPPTLYPHTLHIAHLITISQ